MPIDAQSSEAAESAARAAYGRLLAYLSMQWKDVAAAEDALSDAFLQALRTWPKQGVPERPEAWLYSVAKRKMIDGHRHRQASNLVDVEDLDVLSGESEEGAGFPETRLRLMLLCAHPSIDPGVRAALMLQTVLGVDVRTMASAFLLSPEALTKRLGRAKLKIRDAGIRFELPGQESLPERMHDVLEAIYAAYFLGSDASQIDGDAPDTLSQEALYLADLVAALERNHAEALGLLSLMSFCEARRSAQISEENEFIPLAEQDPTRWNATWIKAGRQLLSRALRLGHPGMYQTEAAIQAAHCSKLETGATPWQEIARLYDALSKQTATLAVCVGLATAKAFAAGEGAIGLQLLGAPDKRKAGYLPYWLARSHFFLMHGDQPSAIDSLRRAIGLATNDRVRRHLLKRLRSLI